MNQYYQVLTDDAVNGDVAQGYRHDADGNLIEGFAAGDANGDGKIDIFDNDAFVYAITHTESQFEAAYPNGNYWACDTNGDNSVDVMDVDTYSALLTGYNGGSSMFAMACTYDGENRLIEVAPTGTPLDGQKRLTMTYDYRGRRVRKEVKTYVDDPNDPNDGSWQETADTRVVYDGWRVLLELDGLDQGGPGVPPVNSVMRKYAWGLDLSNSLEGAGGIGGLLAMSDPDDPNDPNDTAGDYVYAYDANGNVGQLVDVTPSDPNDPNTAIAAHYEYDPYGNRVNYDPNEPEPVNPFRFSTKYLHEETGQYDFGGRIYDARLGRWMTRDPAGERGIPNLYAALRNNAHWWIDPDGRDDILLPGQGPWPPADQCPDPGDFPGRPPINPPTSQPKPCPVVYPEPDKKWPKEDYDCLGLVVRQKITNKDPQKLRDRMDGPRDCSKPCKPCEIKCWFWEYTVEVRRPGSTSWQVLAERGEDGRLMVQKLGHVVCGQVPSDGSAPKCWNKLGIYGDLEGPGECSKWKPDNEYLVEGGPETENWKARRTFEKTECYCGSVDDVTGTPFD